MELIQSQVLQMKINMSKILEQYQIMVIHTIGLAIEFASQGKLLHGEFAIGKVLANVLAKEHRRNNLSYENRIRICFQNMNNILKFQNLQIYKMFQNIQKMIKKLLNTGSVLYLFKKLANINLILLLLKWI
ncbi:unnamed protein product [Paramecium primaurelia]|uniref:Uncharacterized protein n=1 Tax=Paramecium primaurelia TaxID=5886 RepID=A0A8S1KCC1_PARPR|nr:unnamed protein product [Paramecium primaurelia]